MTRRFLTGYHKNQRRAAKPTVRWIALLDFH